MNQPAKLSKTGITGWRRVTASDLRTSTENSQLNDHTDCGVGGRQYGPCFAKIKSGRYGTELQTATVSVKLVDQRFIVEIHQHRMVLEVKPTAEDIEPEVLRPALFISEPTRQSRHENLLAQFAQDFADVLFRVTFRDQVDRRLPS